MLRFNMRIDDVARHAAAPPRVCSLDASESSEVKAAERQGSRVRVHAMVKDCHVEDQDLCVRGYKRCCKPMLCRGLLR
jgi:hypothetical protein